MACGRVGGRGGRTDESVLGVDVGHRREQTLCGPSLRDVSAPPVSRATKRARGVRGPTR